MMTGQVSILIPVYSRAAALQAVMPSYLAQANIAKIVLVDDGSEDATPDVMAAFQAQVAATPIEIFRHDVKLGQPSARLTALASVDSEWVLFGEDDVALAPDYVQTLLDPAQQAGADRIPGGLVNGAVIGPLDLAHTVRPE
jgi:glycosyltransferase involved in cell wall biosynthesis